MYSLKDVRPDRRKALASLINPQRSSGESPLFQTRSSSNDCVLPSTFIVTGVGQVCLDVPPVRRNLSCSSTSLPSANEAFTTGKPSWLIQPSMIRLTSVPDASWRLDHRS